MRWTSASRRPTPSWNAFAIDHDVERLAVAFPHVDRLGVGHQPAHDHLPVAHVVFFDLRAFAHAAQLHQRVARVAFVLGAARSRDDRRRRRGRAPPASDSAGNRARRDRRALLRARSTAPSARPDGLPFSRSAILPEACPITSCMFGRQLARRCCSTSRRAPSLRPSTRTPAGTPAGSSGRTPR